MRAANDGTLSSIQLGNRPIRDWKELRRNLVAWSSPNMPVELAMQCDPALKIKHVHDAFNVVPNYTTEFGDRVTLFETVRPVSWGGPLSGIGTSM